MNNIKQFRILDVSKKQLFSSEIIAVEATTDLGTCSYDDYAVLLTDRGNVTDEFYLSVDSTLIDDVLQAYEKDKIWQVDMSKFQTKSEASDENGIVGIRTIHEELVNMDIEAMLKKAIQKSVLARMGFEGFDELKTYEVKVTTKKNGYVNANHNIENLVAENDDDAYKTMLSVVSQREGRIIRSSDILSYIIIPKKGFTSVP